MKLKTLYCLSTIGILTMPVGSAQATELIFQFTNPSFGGNPLNGSYLLGKAQAQNSQKAPRSVVQKPDELDQFADSLRRQILYRLSRDIIDKIFGDDDSLEAGHFELGGFEVNVIEDMEGINLIITNIETGNQTEIKLPFTP
jgi:curli production assembly/transport component CsgF